MGMGKRKKGGHKKKDRNGDNAEQAKAVRAAFIAAKSFLDGDGSFSDGMQKLIAAGAVSKKDFSENGLSDAIFNKVSKGEKVSGLGSSTRRSLMELGSTNVTRQASEFGIRVQ